MQQVLLDIKGLSAKYQDGKDILFDIDLQAKEGEITCIIGESGCGKSTLLNSILCIPGRLRITEGRIDFEGHDLQEYSDEELRKMRGTKMGMVFQEPAASLNPIRKIRIQYLEALRAHRKIGKQEAYQKSIEILSRMEFQDPDRILESCPVELSGGMNQRTAIAMAMLLEPKVLLADEPTSALDVTVQAQILEEMLKLRNTFGTCIIMVTHNMGVVAKVADKVAVMYCGHIVEYGTREEVLKNPSHPYTKALMSVIPTLDGKKLKGIGGKRPDVFPKKGCAFCNRCVLATKECESKHLQKVKISNTHWTLCDVEGTRNEREQDI